MRMGLIALASITVFAPAQLSLYVYGDAGLTMGIDSLGFLLGLAVIVRMRESWRATFLVILCGFLSALSWGIGVGPAGHLAFLPAYSCCRITHSITRPPSFYLVGFRQNHAYVITKTRQHFVDSKYSTGSQPTYSQVSAIISIKYRPASLATPKRGHCKAIIFYLPCSLSNPDYLWCVGPHTVGALIGTPRTVWI